MKRTLFLLAFALLAEYGFSQNVDSLLAVNQVDSLLAAATVLWRAGEAQEALPLAQQAADISKKKWGEYNASYAASLHRLASVYNSLSQNDKAEALYLEAIKLKSKVLGKEHPDYIASVSNLAILYHAQGNYSEAEPLLLEIVSIRLKVSGKEHPDYARSLNNLAVLYMDKSDYLKAEELYLEAKEIWAKTPGKEHPIYTASLYNLAVLYMRKGDYIKAELLYLEAIEIRSKVQGKDHQDYAMALNGLANLYAQKGDFTKAEPLYIEGKGILAKALGEEHPDYAVFLNNFANLYGEKGDYAKAEPLFLEAKEIWANTLGKEYPGYLNVLDNLGTLYWEKGEYEKVESLFSEAKEIRVKSLGKEHPDYAESLSKLAGFYSERGDYPKAESLFLEAIEIRAKALGKDHPDYGVSLNNLANLYLESEKGNFPKAEPLFLEAKEIFAKSLGKQHAYYANSLNNLALVYEANDDYAKAEPLFLEAKEIRERALGREHPDYAKSLSNLALLYIKKGDYDKAELLSLEAKEIFVKTLGKEHLYYATSLSGLANLYQSTNRIAESAALFLEMNELNRRLIENSAAYSSESQMLAYLQTFEDELAQFYSFSQANPSPELNSASFDNSLFYNGFLLENVRRLSWSILGTDSLTYYIYERWQGCRRRLANEYAKPVTERRHVADVEAEAEHYEKMLIKNQPTLGEIFYAPRWEDVHRRLQSDEAAVQFIHYPYYEPNLTDSTMYAALVLLPGENIPHFLPLFEERQLPQSLHRPGLLDEITVKDLYGNNPELYRLLWQPLEPLLRNAKTVYYSPSGLLHRLNPAALLDESGASVSNGRKWVRLGSTGELILDQLADKSFAKSNLATLEDTMPITARQLSVLIYGGITYNMDSLAFIIANPSEALDTGGTALPKSGNFRYSDNEQTSGKRSESKDGWLPLPGTEIEINQVSAMFRKMGFLTEVQKGYLASEERLKKEGKSDNSPRILHIATHGFSYPDPRKEPSRGFRDSDPTYKLLEDPMMRSGLVLAGANFFWKNKRPLKNREDGVLVAYEVRDINLQNTELVVLSACQTGLGDVVGSEGVYGLQRAFQIAGAKFLIVSLWQIPDKQTQELMQLFYQNWLEKAESLRDAFTHAQKTMKKKYPNPYFWAGFVLVE